MKKTIVDYDIKDKKVIIRVDFNVPMKDGVILDDTRIVASLKTIKYAIDNGAKVILMSHLGKVKTNEDKLKNDLYPVSVRLGELLGLNVRFYPHAWDSELINVVNEMKNGEVILLQNTRYEDIDGNRESGCDLNLAKSWASLGDIFINDAYGTSHRSHASNVGISKFLPSGVGFLVNDEISKLDNIMNEDTHPFVVIMGGAKVHDKIQVINNLIKKCDYLLVGGGMAYTFLKADGKNIGSSLLDSETLDYCKEILENYCDKIILPIDHVVLNGDEVIVRDEMLDDDIGYDIGNKTIELFNSYLGKAKRVVINGPVGYFEDERFSNGTRNIYKYITDNHIKALVGGGDSASSVNKLSNKELFYHISTGGGATLEYLEGKVLPGIEAISEK